LNWMRNKFQQNGLDCEKWFKCVRTQGHLSKSMNKYEVRFCGYPQKRTATQNPDLRFCVYWLTRSLDDNSFVVGFVKTPIETLCGWDNSHH
jgi:hypothetical protein